MIAVIADAGVEASIALHQALEFRAIGRMERVGFKHDRWVDVDLLQLDLHTANGLVETGPGGFAWSG